MQYFKWGGKHKCIFALLLWIRILRLKSSLPGKQYCILPPSPYLQFALWCPNVYVKTYNQCQQNTWSHHWRLLKIQLFPENTWIHTLPPFWCGCFNFAGMTVTGVCRCHINQHTLTGQSLQALPSQKHLCLLQHQLRVRLPQRVKEIQLHHWNRSAPSEASGVRCAGASVLVTRFLLIPSRTPHRENPGWTAASP